MVDRRYDSTSLSKEENIFRNYFDQLVSLFGSQYEIWIRSEDFNRTVGAGLVNRQSEAAVTIYFKRGGTISSNPISLGAVEQARQHLNLGVGDLEINSSSHSNSLNI